MKQTLINHFKNIGGWTTKRKILCFAVDDYGNVRLNHPDVIKKLKPFGYNTNNHFNINDALSTKEDFEQLFDTLSSVKDKNNRSAVFTTYALSANIDFDKTLALKDDYYYELLPDTYARLASEQSSYKGAYKLLHEGIQSKLIKPQFHGREHLNVEMFKDFLKAKDPLFIENLKNKSYSGLPQLAQKPNVYYSQAFAFWKYDEIKSQKEIIKDGLQCFEQVYGYASKTFTPPGQRLHPNLYEYLEKLNIISIDKPRKVRRHIGEYEYVNENNKLGIQSQKKHVTVVRNVVFEPSANRSLDWVNHSFRQVQAAFRLNKPAIVSSHRVNFCGHINPNNKSLGLKQLKALLCKIVQYYPDVEFISVDELAEEIIKTTVIK